MEEEIKKALEVLKSGGIILYPTDTVWGIGCDATHVEAVQKIFKLKNRDDKKAMICLVSDVEMLNAHVEQIPVVALDLIEMVTRPTTIIYDNPKSIAPNLIAEDNTLGIRVTHNEFCARLVAKMGVPLVSTSANISGEPTPKGFHEISDEIRNGVDYVVNLHREKTSGSPSSIIKLSMDGTIKIIRE